MSKSKIENVKSSKHLGYYGTVNAIEKLKELDQYDPKTMRKETGLILQQCKKMVFMFYHFNVATIEERVQKIMKKAELFKKAESNSELMQLLDIDERDYYDLDNKDSGGSKALNRYQMKLDLYNGIMNFFDDEVLIPIFGSGFDEKEYQEFIKIYNDNRLKPKSK